MASWTVKRQNELKKVLHPLTYYDMFKKEPMQFYCNGELVFDYTPSDYCGCGRRYDDNDFGFWQRKKSIINAPKHKNVVMALRLPELCIFCYYFDELDKGLWAPKFIQEKYRLTKK